MHTHTHTHGEAPCERPAAGTAGCRCCCCCRLEETGMNSLARGIRPFQVFVHFEAIGGQRWEPLRGVLQKPFLNENSMFRFDYFWVLLFVPFYFFGFLRRRCTLYLEGGRGAGGWRPVTPRQQTYGSCRWSFWRSALPVRCVPACFPKKKKKTTN